MPTLDEYRRTNKGGENDGVYAQFFIAAVPDQARTKELGRPMYKDTEMVKIILSGDNKTQVVQEVNDYFRERFSRQYQAFRASTDQVSANGTPLSQWPMMTPALVRNFAGLGIYTVEQLAQMSDSGIAAGGMGSREWAKKAQVFLEQAEGGAVVQKLASENEELRRENEGLRRQVEAFAARIEKMVEEAAGPVPEVSDPSTRQKRQRPKSDLTADQGVSFEQPQMPTVL